jgi:serine/threonine protein kinase
VEALRDVLTEILPKQLFGYEVVSRLGEGAGSVLYVVCDPESGQLNALKHVVRKEDKDIRYLEQLENEFNVSKQFRHPGLRKAVDLKQKRRLMAGVVEAALVMELVDGTPLDDLPLQPMPKLLDIFTQVAQAIAGLHYVRYVHCDLKPSNVLICPDGKVKVIDFGQAAKFGTVKERVQGTPDFIAPEQVRCKAVDPTTDVFCLGATMYWALTGRRMPTLFTVHKSDRNVVREQLFPSPRELNDQVPDPLSKLTMWCVKISRGARPADMHMVVAGLAKVAEAVSC